MYKVNSTHQTMISFIVYMTLQNLLLFKLFITNDYLSEFFGRYFLFYCASIIIPVLIFFGLFGILEILLSENFYKKHVPEPKLLIDKIFMHFRGIDVFYEEQKDGKLKKNFVLGSTPTNLIGMILANICMTLSIIWEYF